MILNCFWYLVCVFGIWFLLFGLKIFKILHGLYKFNKKIN